MITAKHFNEHYSQITISVAGISTTLGGLFNASNGAAVNLAQLLETEIEPQNGSCMVAELVLSKMTSMIMVRQPVYRHPSKIRTNQVGCGFYFPIQKF